MKGEIVAGGFFEDEGPKGVAGVSDIPERQRIIQLLDQATSNVARGNGKAARDYLLDALNAVGELFGVDTYV